MKKSKWSKSDIQEISVEMINHFIASGRIQKGPIHKNQEEEAGSLLWPEQVRDGSECGSLNKKRQKVVKEFHKNRFFPAPKKPNDFPRLNSRDCTVNGLDLVDTCTSHPEQYDVFIGELPVGYLRLRDGRYYAEAPYCGGVRVHLESNLACDGQFRIVERQGYLEKGVNSIIEWWGNDTDSEVFKKADHRSFGDRVSQWADEQMITKNGKVSGQLKKLREEENELIDALIDNDPIEIKDAIGDCAVVLAVVAHMNSITFEECLEYAWNEIKDRKGEVNEKGVFVKE